jgi:hypothetical protein
MAIQHTPRVPALCWPPLIRQDRAGLQIQSHMGPCPQKLETPVLHLHREKEEPLWLRSGKCRRARAEAMGREMKGLSGRGMVGVLGGPGAPRVRSGTIQSPAQSPGGWEGYSTFRKPHRAKYSQPKPKEHSGKQG